MTDTLVIYSTEQVDCSRQDSCLTIHEPELSSITVSDVEMIIDSAPAISIIEVGVQGPAGITPEELASLQGQIAALSAEIDLLKAR